MRVGPEKNALLVTKYLLFRHGEVGDFATNLKLQKLIYYVYVWCLVHFKKRAFEERMQAWPIGPVLPSIYRALKKYGSSPVDMNFSGIKTYTNVDKMKAELGKDLLRVVDSVYEYYGTKSAFELVALTHRALPWKNARVGLRPEAKSENELADDDITKYYGKVTNTGTKKRR